MEKIIRTRNEGEWIDLGPGSTLGVNSPWQLAISWSYSPHDTRRIKIRSLHDKEMEHMPIKFRRYILNVPLFMYI